MLQELVISKKPKVLVVTPLLPGHKVSKITKKTIKRNDTPFSWVSYSGENNIPTNAQKGINEYQRKWGMVKYFLMIDRDIEAGRHLIDRMYETLERSNDDIAYCYASFEFRGYVNASFPADTFDMIRLLEGNYISSNSMMKMSCLEEIGGLITDGQYTRLLDWALWLNFLRYGYSGIPCPDAYFIAHSDKEDVSAGTKEDYRLKYNRVKRDFAIPVINNLMVHEETKQ